MLILIIVTTALAVVVYASFFEHTLHRYVMHRPLGRFRYPYDRHALIHHRVFRSDKSYHATSEEGTRTIPMAKWNGPVLILIAGSPFMAVSWWVGTWSIAITAVITIALYYTTYEYTHWCMHYPKQERIRLVEKLSLFGFNPFFRMNGHHLLHHRYMKRNFNVVLPLADLILGTLLTRSPLRFKQAVGPLVPNVQPISGQEATQI